MIAAIYARKSPKSDSSGDQSESVVRQIAHAREYAHTNGWTVAADHVYVDDLISGAEFLHRPAYARLMEVITTAAGPPFEILVMSDQDRLGRDMLRTASALRDIAEAGVRVFGYLDRKEITTASLMDQMQVIFQGSPGNRSARRRASGPMMPWCARPRRVTSRAGSCTATTTWTSARQTASGCMWSAG